MAIRKSRRIVIDSKRNCRRYMDTNNNTYYRENKNRDHWRYPRPNTIKTTTINITTKRNNIRKISKCCKFRQIRTSKYFP